MSQKTGMKSSWISSSLVSWLGKQLKFHDHLIQWTWCHGTVLLRNSLKCDVCQLPLPNNLCHLKNRIAQATATVILDMLQGMWQMMDYCWHVCCVIDVAILKWPNWTTATKIWDFNLSDSVIVFCSKPWPAIKSVDLHLISPALPYDIHPEI
jgi:hypothetical protein